MKRIAVVMAVVALAGCPAKPTTLEVLPSPLKFLTAGDTIILITHLSDKNGVVVEHAPCMFVTGDPLIASVNQDGTVTANGGGATVVRVSCEGLTTAVPVKVSLPAKAVIEAKCDVRCIQMSNDPLTLKLEGIGASAKLSARITDDAGELVPVEPRWDVADPDFRAGARRLGVEISKEGEVKANGAKGKYLVLLTAGNVVARGNIEVTLPEVDVVKAQGYYWLKPGAEEQLDPKGFRRSPDGSLKPVTGAKFGFTSNNPDVVKVGDEGKLTAVKEGSTDIVVAADSGAFAQVQITVADKDPLAVPPAPEPKPGKGPAPKAPKKR